MSEKISPFEFLNAINDTKQNIMIDDVAEKEYNAWIVNRSLSYFQDTALIVNEVNLHSFLPNRMQFDFLMSVVRKKKRFTKFSKADKLEEAELLQQAYGYSRQKAMEVVDLLKPEDIEALRQSLYTGGRSKYK